MYGYSNIFGRKSILVLRTLENSSRIRGGGGGKVSFAFHVRDILNVMCKTIYAKMYGKMFNREILINCNLKLKNTYSTRLNFYQLYFS